MQHHLSSATWGLLTGFASLAIPDGVWGLAGKLAFSVVVALITGVVHGLAKRWTAGRAARKGSDS